MDYNYRLEFTLPDKYPYRSIAFLVTEDPKVTAHQKFNTLRKKKVRAFNTQFDGWKDGHTQKKWYHGWDSSSYSGKYTKCFVFKYKNNRLYGFLWNPIEENYSYQICVLIIYDTKKEHETDETNLSTVEHFRILPDVQKGIRKSLKEFINGKALDREKH